MNETYTLRVQRFGKRCVFALCNHEKQYLCTVPHEYVTGRAKPNYPMPAIPTYIEINPDEVVLWQYTTKFYEVFK